MATTASAVAEICARARDAARALATIDGATRNAALEAIADAVEERTQEILEANERDMEAGREAELHAGLLDRLQLDEQRLAGIAADVRAIVALPDPVGETIDGHRLENGLDVRRVRVPLGVVAVVYEARPNVTVDCSALCLKSGNAIVLRGSSMAAHSNAVLAQVVSAAATAAGIPEGAVSIVGGRRPRRAAPARHPGRADRPDHPARGRGAEGGAQGARHRARHVRGGGQLPRVRGRSRRTSTTRCRITVNAKVQRPSVCNAAETLLVHADAAADFLPRALGELRESGVELRVDGRTRSLAGVLGDSLSEATEEDWSTEYHALILAVKVVDSVDEAIEHVNHYGSGHSEAIVTGSVDVRAGVHRRRGRRLRLRQRLHALHRRRRVRHGRRDRQLDSEASRARADRRARAHHLQVRGRGLRAGPGVGCRG